MFEALEHTLVATWIRESPSIFGFTLVLALHAIGLAMAIGLGTVVAIRLLGGLGTVPLAALRKVVRLMYLGFAISFVSGFLLFMAEAQKMGVMPAFWGKMAFVAVGMFITWWLDRTILSPAASQGIESVGAAGRRLAYLSLAIWYLALMIGRLTGYPELAQRILGI